MAPFDAYPLEAGIEEASLVSLFRLMIDKYHFAIQPIKLGCLDIIPTPICGCPKAPASTPGLFAGRLNWRPLSFQTDKIERRGNDQVERSHCCSDVSRTVASSGERL
jgi:hypothetical protein